jgi:hypothetical protein
MSFRFHSVDPLRAIEEWTGHRTPSPPRDPMKLLRQLLTLVILALAVLYAVSCSTIETKTTVTDPVTGLVTVTESKTTAPDSASVTALSSTAQAFAPRAVIVNSGK